MNKEEYPVFKKEFWDWFDKLPAIQKQKFWYYKDDMAETNFHFTVWEKKEKNDEQHQ